MSYPTHNGRMALVKHCLFLLGALLLLSGCIAPKAFVEPKYGGSRYTDITVPEKPRAVQLTVTGQTNGKENRRAGEFWKRQVEKVLTASRMFEMKEGAGVDSLVLTINNVGDIGSAAGKGFVTGLTFGAVGSLVTDGYVMTARYTRAGQPEFVSEYKHAIYTTIGNASPPPGITAVSLSEAPAQVAQDLVLKLLVDLQRSEAAAAKTATSPTRADAGSAQATR